MSQQDSQKKFDLSLFRRVLALALPYRNLALVAILLAVLLAPLAIARPRIVQKIVDEFVFVGDIEGMTFWAAIVFGVIVLEAICRYAFIYISNWLGQSIIRDFRVRVFNHINSLKLSYFDKTPIGTSTTRTINDIQSINSIFTEGVITIMADLISIVAVLAVMINTSWRLTLICLTTMPFLVLASYIFKEAVKKSYQSVRTQIQKMNAFLQERITGMRIVQIFNAEEQERKSFAAINKDYRRANIDAILYYAIFFPTVDIIAAASLALMVWWGASDVARAGGVTLGALVAFPIYINMLFRPIRVLADKFNTLQMGLVAAERVFGVLDRTDQIENKGTVAPGSLKGDVSFKNVWFAYNDEEWILRDLSFELQAGQTLAIVGSTGSGKTTITNIINRFYEYQQGTIAIDGIPLRDYELFALRSRMAMVLQDVFLFTGTVLENITLRDPAISRERVVEAAKLIGAHEFIEKLPGGYDYDVQERGATLSMGQRQLISFVRALVFDPDILILDEATSSVDPETEGVIQHAIEKLIDRRTSIVIAHRLSTIRNADNIMVLEKGQIKEFGSHDALIQNTDGRYRELYEMQFLEAAE
ncbi:ABC transporter ATP-binding protein [Neolewinella lacunae]|uniref:ABC transporter ATP-binding protein n=1 Tax=Neolewinella lacunae TaxID=1517758 RepID=A0A923PNC3_9BACT|nr:ABC transporter ATP-binding protein [Neolewinella lacunae]MBC6995886.1 ABC transporter ATP-binding protein [Neolewinella lacunae]MDN3636422.1 ABC transporter ATP-binding protein [Neolewinella lacunae]